MTDNKCAPQAKKKFLYLLGGFAVALLIGYSLIPEKEHPIYHPNLGATIMDDSTWSAAQRFTSLSDCNASGDPDDQSVDWVKLSDYGIANVCLFYLFETMGGPEEVAKWLKDEGFKTSEPYQYHAGPSTMKHFGYDPQKKITAISANWSLKGQLKKFAVAGQKNNVAYSQSVGTEWFPDGKLKLIKTLSNIN